MATEEEIEAILDHYHTKLTETNMSETEVIGEQHYICVSYYTTISVSSNHYICVLLTLYMSPTTVCVVVLIEMCVLVLGLWEYSGPLYFKMNSSLRLVGVYYKEHL